jgi:hypothetical protein
MLLRCENDTDCEAIEAATEIKLRCVRNICVLSHPKTCYRHSDCEESGKLCSADGLCVEGIWQVENQLPDENIDFEMYSKSCSTPSDSQFEMESYDMYGASPWQRIPGVLEMFGMCSYRNWYEYLELVDPRYEKREDANAEGICDGELKKKIKCTPDSFDIDKTMWWETGRGHEFTTSRTIRTSKWSNFSVEAHPCDRDYMHIRDTMGCSPRIYNDNSAMGIIAQAGGEGQNFESPLAQRARNAQTIERIMTSENVIRQFINMAGRPSQQQLSNETFRRMGFLGVSDVMSKLNSQESRFRDCSTIDQCRKVIIFFPFFYLCFCFLLIFECVQDDFTFLGKKESRQSTTNVAGISSWSPANGESCGGFGILLDPPSSYQACIGLPSDHKCCMVDGAVAPLYRILCGASTKDQPISVTENVFDSVTNKITPKTVSLSFFFICCVLS